MTTRLDDSGVTFPDGSVQAKAAYPGIYFYAALGADVALNNTANYFDGPSLTLGTGVWLVTGKISVTDTSGAAGQAGKLWDGTTVFDSSYAVSPAGNQPTVLSFAAVVVNPVGNVRISAKNVSSNNGIMKSNNSGNSKDSSITAVRIG